MSNGTPLRLNTKEWIWLLVVITSAGVGVTYSQFRLSETIQSRLVELDEHWEDRVRWIQSDLRLNADKTQSALSGLIDQVHANSKKIEVLQEQVKRLER